MARRVIQFPGRPPNAESRGAADPQQALPRVSEHPATLDDQLRLAIASKRLIEVRYHGVTRVAEPHDYGIQKGNARVLVYQLRASNRGPGQGGIGWRLLELSKIEQAVVLEQTFPGSRGPAHRDHQAWDVVYARVE